MNAGQLVFASDLVRPILGYAPSGNCLFVIGLPPAPLRPIAFLFSPLSPFTIHHLIW